MPVHYRADLVVGSIAAQLDPVQKQQLPFARALAATRTAQLVKARYQAVMPVIFDRPTPFTIKSLAVKSATKSKPEASVEFKGDYGAKGHYLWPQIEGGQRVQKPFEMQLQNSGILDPGYRTVPGEGAKLDAYGNMSPGQVVQILSQLRLQKYSGFESRLGGKTWDAKKAARSVKRQGYAIFVVNREVNSAARKAGGRWRPPGIYARYDFAFGSAVKPLLLFVRSPMYRARFKFDEIGMKEAQSVFPGEFERALAEAIKTGIVDLTSPL